MISYIVQAVVTLICGPLMGVVHYVFELNGNAPANQWTKIFKLVLNLSGSVGKGTIFVSLSVLITSWIRIAQVPPNAELDFIRALGFYELFIVLAASVSQRVAFVIDPERRSDMVIYNIAIISWTVNAIFMNMYRYPSPEEMTLRQIMTYCRNDWNFRLPIASKEDIKRKDAVTFGIVVVLVLIGFHLFMLVGVILEPPAGRINTILRNPFRAIHHFTNTKATRIRFRKYVAVPCLTIY